VVNDSVTEFGVAPNPRRHGPWSPSSYNRLSACGLQAAFMADHELRQKFVMPNTFTSLGIVAHRITEMAWSNDFDSVNDDEIERALFAAWDKELENQEAVLARKWHPSVPPASRDWPFASVSRQRNVRRVATEIRNFRDRRGVRDGHPESLDNLRPIVEREICDADINLCGTPDRVIFEGNNFTVFDLKTGSEITEISEPHRRQLLLYAHLVVSVTGCTPISIAIVTSSGDIIEEVISVKDVTLAIEQFLAYTHDFENAAGDPTKILALAKPGPETCKWCSFRAVCSSYWSEGQPTDGNSGFIGQIVAITSTNSMTMRQILPESGSTQLVGVSNVRTEDLQLGEVVSIMGGFQRESSLRGHWNTRIEVLSGLTSAVVSQP